MPPAGSRDDEPAFLSHPAAELDRLNVGRVIGRHPSRSEDGDLSLFAKRREDLEGVPQFFEGAGQNLEVAARRPVATEFVGGLFDVGDERVRSVEDRTMLRRERIRF